MGKRSPSLEPAPKRRKEDADQIEENEVKENAKEAEAAPSEKSPEQLEDLGIACCPWYWRSWMHRSTVISIISLESKHTLYTLDIDSVVKFWRQEQQTFLQVAPGVRAFKGSEKSLGSCVDRGDAWALALGDRGGVALFDGPSCELASVPGIRLPPVAGQQQRKNYTGAVCFMSDCLDPTIAVGTESGSVNIFTFCDGRPEAAACVTSMATASVSHLLSLPDRGVLVIDEGGGIDAFTWLSDLQDTIGEKYPRPEWVEWRNSKMDTDLFCLQTERQTPLAAALDQRTTTKALFLAVLTRSTKSTESGSFHPRFLHLFNVITGRRLAKLQLLAPEPRDPAEEARRQAFEQEVKKEQICWTRTNIGLNLILVPGCDAIEIVHVSLKGELKLDPRSLGGAEPVRWTAMAVLDGNVAALALGSHRVFVLKPNAPEPKGNAAERDVINELPTQEELQFAAATAHAKNQAQALPVEATIFTSLGDIVLKLFAEESPKTVENFVTHSRNGYYDGVIFHRVIKDFMIQTGDPRGDGTGGESIWGGEFPDEFHRSLRHDRPFTLSMANAGPNTNGSQFFITTAACSFLDDKHTVFGRVVAGMDVVRKIEHQRTSGADRPVKDIRILTIKVAQKNGK